MTWFDLVHAWTVVFLVRPLALADRLLRRLP